MGCKYWRITNEQEFYEKAEKYIHEHVERFMNNGYLNIKNGRKAKLIRSNYDEYKSIPDQYTYEKITAGLYVVLEDIDDWSSFSSSTDTPLDEIMLRALINRIFKCDYVCILLTSVNKYLTEDFIDDIIYVSSNYFKFEEWDDEHVEAVSTCAAKMKIPNKFDDMIKLYGKDRAGDKLINIKFDFTKINPIGKSKHFLDKYFEAVSNSTSTKNKK